MPQNNNLDPVNLPMTLRFDEGSSTEFLNDIDALEIELVDHPTAEQMRDVAYRYVKATWADTPSYTDPSNATSAELSENLEDVLNFRLLLILLGIEQVRLLLSVLVIDFSTMSPV